MEILLPRTKYTHEILGTHGGALLPKRAPGACSWSEIPRLYRPLDNVSGFRYDSLQQNEEEFNTRLLRLQLAWHKCVVTKLLTLTPSYNPAFRSN